MRPRPASFVVVLLASAVACTREAAAPSQPRSTERDACLAAMLLDTETWHDVDAAYLVEGDDVACESATPRAIEIARDSGHDAFVWDPAFDRPAPHSCPGRCGPVRGAERVSFRLIDSKCGSSDDGFGETCLPSGAVPCADECVRIRVRHRVGSGGMGTLEELRCHDGRWCSTPTSLAVY